MHKTQSEQSGIIDLYVFDNQLTSNLIRASELEVGQKYWGLARLSSMNRVVQAARFPAEMLAKEQLGKTALYNVRFAVLDDGMNVIDERSRIFGDYIWEESSSKPAKIGEYAITKGFMVPFKPFAPVNGVSRLQLKHWLKRENELDDPVEQIREAKLN
jgi:hypothetical protein